MKLGAGTIATLTALVLGLLVSSAKNSFDTTNNGLVQSSAKIILLDRALARYGPETKAAREQLKRAVASTIEIVWPTEKTGVSALTAVERAKGVELVQEKLSELTPKNDFQRQTLAGAQQIVGDLSQTRWLLIELIFPTTPDPGPPLISSEKKEVTMSKSFTIFGLISLLVLTGCMTQAEFLTSKQPTAIQAAVSRGQFEMNCPNATGQVLSQEVTQPAIPCSNTQSLHLPPSIF